MQVDYSHLTLSVGPVAPVGFESLGVESGNVLTATFVKNPLHLRSNNYDKVYLYVYCPERRQGYLALPVNRSDKRISVVLSSYFTGCEVHVYGFVQDDMGRCSESEYVGSAVVTPTVADTREVKVDAIENQKKKTEKKKQKSAHTSSNPDSQSPSDPVTQSPNATVTPTTEQPPSPPPTPPDTSQLSLF